MRNPRGNLIAALVGAIGIAACSPRDIVSSGGSAHDRIGSVRLSVHNATVLVNDTLRLTALVLDTAGIEMPNEGVSWQSTDTTVSTVATSGVIRARKVGVAKIVASAARVSDTASVTVATAGAPVYLVTVVLNGSSLTVGQTTQAIATLRDSAGNVLSGRAVAWTSGSAAVAIVDSDGLVTAKSAGSAAITATSEGKFGSATLSITSPSTQQAGCASPQAAWIWCDDFEQDRTFRYFEYDSTSFARVPGVGRNGSTGMRAQFASGQVLAGALRLAFGKTPSSYFRPVDAGTANYRELYYRVYVKNQNGWIGGGGDKLMRAIVFTAPDWSEAAIGHVWSGSSPYQNYLVLDPASGTDSAGNVLTVGYNDFAHLRWWGGTRSQTPIFDAAHVGQWYCVEAHMKLNTPAQSDGVFELRINGNLEAQRTGMNWLGSYQTYGINAVFLENYWNAGSPQAQERYFDDFVVSTQPIGC